MSQLFKYFERLLLILVILFYGLFLVLAPVTTTALSQSDYDALSHPFFDPSTVCGVSGSSAVTSSAEGSLKSGDKVYIVGDSITDGAAAKYNELFAAKQITTTISAVAGRSWVSAGNIGAGSEGTTGPAKDAVVTDTQAIKDSKAIVVALGTNGYLNGNPIDEIINTIHGINASAPIYWVNISQVGVASVPGFNTKLSSSAATGSFKIIDWAKTVDPSGDGTKDPGSLLRDGTHPNPAGYQKLGELVVNATTSGAAASAQSGSTGEVKSEDLSYMDESRPGRTVGVTVWSPGDSSTHPLVMFAPGRDQNSKSDGFYKRYLKAIAAQGFIVAGANYAQGNNDADSDVPGQADDIKFLITKMLGEEKVKGKINTSSGVGLFGHSDGGFVSGIVGYADGKKDERIKVVILESGANFGGFTYKSGPPMLAMAGSNDTGNSSGIAGAYSSIQTPYSAHATFKGADHAQWIVADNSTYKESVDAMTGAFLKRMLSNDGSDATKLSALATKYTDKFSFEEKGADNPSGSGSSSSSTSGSGCACSASGGTATSLNGNDNEQKSWNYFISKGFSTVQAAAAMGNMLHEGHFEPKQLEIQYSPAPHIWESADTMPAPIGPAGQPGYGIIQWTSVGRKQGLLDLAKSRGLPIHDLGIQLDFMWSELSGSYKKSSLDPLLQSTDLAQAVRIWQDHYEVGAGFDPRFKSANDMLVKYGSNPTGTGSSSSSGPSLPCGSGGGGGNGTVTPITGSPDELRQRILNSPNVKFGNSGNAATQKEDVQNCLTDDALAGFVALAEQSGVKILVNAIARDHGGCGAQFGHSEHNSGGALDIGYYGNRAAGQANHNAEGDKLYKFIYDNRDALKVNQAIWQYPQEGFQCLNAGQPVDCDQFYHDTPKGQVISIHYHHIHVSFKGH